MALYKAPRGTVDILPEEQPYWRYVARAIERLCALYGYERIDTPIFEEAGLFTRGVGEATDIVSKEMYVFEDRGGVTMALRPELTANVCRAYIQHGLHTRPQPIRVHYSGPIFRYDRPQSGRQRQFTQFGVEAIGETDPTIDAEVVEMCWRLYEELGLTGLTMQLNSIGCPLCRPRYIQALRDYYADKLDDLCRDCRERFDKNPLRLLDCKNEQCQPYIAKAPLTIDYLGPECSEHFDALRGYLDALSVPYELNPRLVRGLDYYTKTVFEVVPQEEGGQSTIGAGGRYDGLIEVLGGKPTPGIGFATGIERIILNLKRQNIEVEGAAPPQVFVAYQEEARETAIALAGQLRRNGIGATAAAAGRSLKAQMRQADSLKARYAAIIGNEELASNTVLLRRMGDSQQQRVERDRIVEALEADGHLSKTEERA